METDDSAKVDEQAPTKVETCDSMNVDEQASTNAGAENLTDEGASNMKSKDKPAKKRKRFGKVLVVLGVLSWALLMTVLVTVLVMQNGNGTGVNPEGSGSQVETPVNPDDSGTQDETPNNPENPGAIVSESFNKGVVNIVKVLTDDESISTKVDILIEKIGKDKLAELIGKYGELSVQKGIAQLLVFAPEVKMNQYITNNELDYNLNAQADYSEKLLNATEAYKAETGKNPDGALMSLEGYDTHKFNREAMKELIIKSGDLALLTWYEVKTSDYDLMIKQNKDTAKALEYKESVETEMLSSQGSVDLLVLQLEKEADGTLTVMDNVTMQYTDSYNNFIVDNYIYVIAK